MAKIKSFEDSQNSSNMEMENPNLEADILLN